MQKPSAKCLRLLSVVASFAAIVTMVAAHASETGKGSGSGSGSGSDEDPGKMVETILSCKSLTLQSKDGVDIEERKKKTIEAFKKVFEDAAEQIEPKPTKNEIKQLMAQIISETGLTTLTEGKPNAATTDEQYKGRGFIQVTHKENYQQCADFVQKTKSSRKSETAQIMAGGDAADKLMGNSAKDDLYFAAMCTIAWWQNSKKISKSAPPFEEAVKGGQEKVKRVCELCNAGPNAKDGAKTTDGKVERTEKAFKEVDQCLP